MVKQIARMIYITAKPNHISNSRISRGNDRRGEGTIYTIPSRLTNTKIIKISIFKKLWIFEDALHEMFDRSKDSKDGRPEDIRMSLEEQGHSVGFVVEYWQ